MKTVLFRIHRKLAFQSALVSYKVYLNGQLVGRLKNGQTLVAEIPAARTYFLDVGDFQETNAAILDNHLAEYRILMEQVNGWCTPAHPVFFLQNGRELQALPSFHVDKFLAASFEGVMNQLPPVERELALCLEFWNDLRDETQQVLTSDHMEETREALHKVGAVQYSCLLIQMIQDDFSDVVFPLQDEQLEGLENRICKWTKMFWNDASAQEEFHRVVVEYIQEKLLNRENVY